MNFQEFRRKIFEWGCFHVNQVYAWEPGFDKNNLSRWVQKGYLVRLRNGYYTFPEYHSLPEIHFLIANRIYKPSYVSLHTALAFFGWIPEAIPVTTSVTSLKTQQFQNSFGSFDYRSVKESLVFGYEIKSTPEGFSHLLATREKALLDLLYLNPFYRSEEDMINLRLDDDLLLAEMDRKRLNEYLDCFNSVSLNKRVEKLLKVYGV